MSDKEEILSVSDVCMLESFHRKKYVEDKEGELYQERIEGHTYELIPEDIMAKIQDFVGDGRGSITVGADLSTSVEFGCKAGAFLNVRAACDNSMEAVQEVHNILAPWVREQVENDYREVEDIRERILSGGTPQKEVRKAPAKAAPKPTKKPNFRR